MKKLLSVFLCMAVLLGMGTMAVSAITEEEAEAFEVELAVALVEFNEKLADRTNGLSDIGKSALAYELDAKTKDAEEAWKNELRKWPADYDAVLKAWKAYQIVRLETIQFALTLKVPTKAWNLLGESVAKQTARYVWSWILRYVFFGWAWFPY